MPPHVIAKPRMLVERRIALLALPLAERHGGWILAASLHIAAFGAMVQVKAPAGNPADAAATSVVMRFEAPETAPEPEPEPMQLGIIAKPSPPETPAEQPAIAREPAAEPIAIDASGRAATRRVEVAAAVAAPEPQPQPAVEIPETLVAPESAREIPVGADANEVALEALRDAHPDTFEQLDELARQMDAVNRRQGDAGSSEIADRLQSAQVDQTAAKTLFAEPILSAGVRRNIDLTDVDLEQAQEVLGRFGIQIVLMRVDEDRPLPKQGGFLNSVATRSGTFVRPEGLKRGIVQMFTFGDIAKRKMAQLEDYEIQKRHLDPAAIRVVSVIYGIVGTPTGIDFGIKEFETRPLPSVAGPKAAR